MLTTIQHKVQTTQHLPVFAHEDPASK